MDGVKSEMTRLGKELSSFAQERRELECEIERHTKFIIDKKRRLNSLSIVTCLPPEILSEIFIFCSIDWPLNCAKVPIRRAYTYRWIGITQVCHYWREAALQAPRLWGDISVRCSLECLKEVLARSKKAPLSITADMTRRVATELVLAELGRTTRLDISLNPRSDKPTLPSSAPHLRSVTIRFQDPFYADDVMFRTSTFFDGCDVPALRHLELHNNEFAWSSTIFKPTLTSLIVTNSGRHHSALEELLDALENMPQLESFQLRYALPIGPSSEELPAVSRTVSLPRLRSLTLVGVLRRCIWLMRHLSYPTTTALCIEGTETLRSDVRDLANTLSETLRGASSAQGPAQALKTVAIHNDGSKWDPQFVAWTTRHPVSAFGTSFQTVPQSPLIDIMIVEDFDFHLFNIFCANMPLSDVETFHIAPTRYVTPPKSDWKRVYDRMPKLRELGVGRIAEDILPDVLSMRVPIPETDSSSAKPSKRRRKQPFLPNLKKLVLQDLAYRPSFEEMHDDVRPGRYRKMLAARQRSRCQIEELVIDRCANISEADVDKLRELVGAVQWDPASVIHELPELPDSEDDWSGDEDDFDDGAIVPGFLPFFF